MGDAVVTRAIGGQLGGGMKMGDLAAAHSPAKQ
jgi:hypothetical protein